MSVVVISLGNSLRGDDGVASVLCHLLPAYVLSQIQYFDLGIHGEQIAFYIKDADTAIIIDAVQAAVAGQLTVYDGIPSHVCKPANSHGLSWFQELSLAGASMPLKFVGVSVANDTWGEGLSEALTERRSALVTELAAIILATIREVDSAHSTTWQNGEDARSNHS